MDDVRKIIYGVLIGFVLMLVVWLSFLDLSGCGFAFNCAAAYPKIERTSIPTLIPATLPIPTRLLNAAAAVTSNTTASSSGTSSSSDIARPSNAGGPGTAIGLKGDTNSGMQIFATNCQTCHNAEGKGGIPNPGSADGTVPTLNPIDPTMKSTDYKTFATNLDLFLEHGSTPDGPGPTFSMPAWGDKKALTPQQIADVISYVISLNPGSSASAGSPTGTSTTKASATSTAKPGAAVTGTAAASKPGASQTQTGPNAAAEIARPSNPGGPGAAIDLTGDAASGQQIFAANCQTCHSAEGKGGIANPGSSDGTVPALNPIDPTLKDPDLKTFATNLDLFIEHGSTPEGTNPTFSMPPWGDKKALNPQQIADVIAYLISLNK